VFDAAAELLDAAPEARLALTRQHRRP